MSATDTVGTVCDRLVGGMMFHSDHADLCRLMGFGRLAKLNEDGYLHDSKAHAKMRRLCVEQTGRIASSGSQDRTKTLDRWHGMSACDVTNEQRTTALKDAVEGWLEWERSTAAIYRSAYRRLVDDNMTLAKAVMGLATDTEGEVAEAQALLIMFESCGWDLIEATRE